MAFRVSLGWWSWGDSPGPHSPVTMRLANGATCKNLDRFTMIHYDLPISMPLERFGVRGWWAWWTCFMRKPGHRNFRGISRTYLCEVHPVHPCGSPSFARRHAHRPQDWLSAGCCSLLLVAVGYVFFFGFHPTEQDRPSECQSSLSSLCWSYSFDGFSMVFFYSGDKMLRGSHDYSIRQSWTCMEWKFTAHARREGTSRQSTMTFGSRAV